MCHELKVSIYHYQSSEILLNDLEAQVSFISFMKRKEEEERKKSVLLYFSLYWKMKHEWRFFLFRQSGEGVLKTESEYVVSQPLSIIHWHKYDSMSTTHNKLC